MIKLNNRGNWSLIALLAAVAIVIIVAAMIFGKNGTGPSSVKANSPLLDPHSKKQTIVGKAIDTSKASVCREQLVQIRQGIQAWKATEATEANPPNLKAIGLSVGQEFYRCPMTNQPYTYDPATGAVKCPTHTNF